MTVKFKYARPARVFGRYMSRQTL